MTHASKTTDETIACDRELAAAVLSGSAAAFEHLVREYQRLCWHVIDRMVRHPDDSRELCQETFLRIYRSLHQYRGDSPLKSWVAQIAYSVAKRHLERKQIPIAEYSGNEDALSFFDHADDSIDLESTAAKAQLSAHLQAAINALPPLQRTLLTLYHLEEMQIADIAQVTGLAEGTIKSHLFRIRKRLREIMQLRIGVIT